MRFDLSGIAMVDRLVGLDNKVGALDFDIAI